MPRAKSAQQKINEGDRSKVGVHRLDAMLQSEPKTENGLPRCSPRLRGDAQWIYQFFVEQLEKSDLAKIPDAYALECACVSLATVWEADRKIQRQGAVIKIPVMSGVGNARKRIGWRQTKNKWLSVKLEAEKEFRIFGNSFGVVGPSSRANLTSEVGPSIQANRELWSLLLTPRSKKTETSN
jgi:phage terminase small subunit